MEKEAMSIDPSLATPFFRAGLKVIIENVFPTLSRYFKSFSPDVSKDYQEHLRHSFEKCSFVRTIINRDRPVFVRDIYVGGQFKCGESKLDDIDLIDHIRRNRHVVVTGTGGGGKTMFMKYFWMSIFEKPNGKMPIFVELRRFNGTSASQFLTFICRTAFPSGNMKQDGFESALRDGHLCLILDGFDEIADGLRLIVEEAILHIAKIAPLSIVLVSSRPDDRFNGWTVFESFKVLPMDQKRVISLIQKVDFNAAVKAKFVARIKHDLYDRHADFLANPLLSTMMLLTFDQFADVPEKIHIFYEQAFETLYLRHDATKEAFKRQSYVDLPIDEFKEILSVACLISYNDYMYEFSEAAITGIIREAIDILEKTVPAELFLKDLLETVCILQRDGLDIRFTHRSFQEFFCAYALVHSMSSNVREILSHLMTGRPFDSVFRMALEMNRDIIENEFVLPTLGEYADDICRQMTPNAIQTLSLCSGGSILLHPLKAGFTAWYIADDIRFNTSFSILEFYGYYDDIDDSDKSLEETRRIVFDLIKKKGLKYNPEKNLNEKINYNIIEAVGIKINIDNGTNISAAKIPANLEFYATISELSKLEPELGCDNFINNIISLRDDIKMRSERRRKSIREILKR